jgi:aminopeptidase N
MDGWFLVGGFPLVTLTAGPATSGVVLTQSPFKLLADPTSSSPAQTWQIPLQIRAGELTHPHLLGPDPYPLPGPFAQKVVNAGGNAYCRTHYTRALLDTVLANLSTLTTIERTNLVADYWALLRASRIELVDFLKVVSHFAQFSTAQAALHGITSANFEPDPETWQTITSALEILDHVADPADRPALADFTRTTLTPLADQLGYLPAPAEPSRTSLLRALLLGALGTTGTDPAVRAWALHYAQDPQSPLSPDLLRPMIKVVADIGDPQDYARFSKRFTKASTPQDIERYLVAIAKFDSPDLVARTLALALQPLLTPTNPGPIRPQDMPTVLATLIDNRLTGASVWHRITELWDSLPAVITEYRMIHLANAAEWLCTDDSLATSVTEFINQHSLPAIARMLDQSTERLAANVAFTHRVRSQLAALRT